MRSLRTISVSLLSATARRGLATRTLPVLSKLTSIPTPRSIGQRPTFIQRRFYAQEVVINAPQFADSITEGELASWNVAVGQQVKQDQLIAIVETDKVNIEINSPENGVIDELYYKPGDTVRTGTKLYKIRVGATGGSSPAASKAEAPKAETPKAEAPKAAAPAAPKAEAPKAETPKAAPAPTPKVETKTQTIEVASERRVKMTRMRLKIAERLKQSQETAASLTTFNEIDMKPLSELRDQYKDAFFKKHGVKLGFMSAFVKAASIALQEIPEVNAYIDGQDIVYHDFTDISVAVATPKGLVTPVMRGVEKMSYFDIEKTLGDLGAKAKENKIAIEDMAGGTFTISNGGVFGSLMGTPIINMPQSAILGMHGIKDRPVAVNGQVVIRPMMYVALTYDHRIIDGREAVTFLVRVKELVEDPRRLLLGL